MINSNKSEQHRGRDKATITVHGHDICISGKAMASLRLSVSWTYGMRVLTLLRETLHSRKGWQGEIVQLTWRKALGYLVLVNMRTNWEHAHAIMGHTSATLITLSTLNLSRLNESYMQTQLATWKFCRTLVAFPYAQFPWPRCGAVQRPRCLAFLA